MYKKYIFLGLILMLLRFHMHAHEREEIELMEMIFFNFKLKIFFLVDKIYSGCRKIYIQIFFNILLIICINFVNNLQYIRKIYCYLFTCKNVKLNST